MESKDKEISDKSNHIQYLEKCKLNYFICIFSSNLFTNSLNFSVIGDKENLKSKKKTDRKKKLYNPDDEVILLTPEDFGSDREVFREVSPINNAPCVLGSSPYPSGNFSHF